MRKFEDGRIRFSPTDLVNHLSCRHLTGLNWEHAHRRREKPRFKDEAAELVAKHGEAHEQRYLEQLRANGHDVTVIDTDAGITEAAAHQTAAAMRAGAEVIYQAAFLHDGWGGFADFLFRRDDLPSDLGTFSYEVFDTKLSRTAKPTALVQLAEYSVHVTRIQGVAPEQVHLVLGDDSLETFRLASIAPYHRMVRRQFLKDAGEQMLAIYPDPVEHCARCDWSSVCRKRRRDDDHLTLVADLGRTQADKLETVGLTTMTELANAGPSTRPSKMDSFDRLQAQARLQVAAGEDGAHHELLQPNGPNETAIGFARLPEPSTNDLFFDIESDPFLQVGGVEYLFGVTDVTDEFAPVWAKDPADERQAFEETIDRFIAALDADPAMHVYHFGIYEPVAFKRLAARHGTRQNELDRLLRGETFVDLHRITKQAVRASVSSYSIKKLERFYWPHRTAEVSSGIESAVEYEKWLVSRERSHLDAIARYNREDCESTRALRNWLEERRTEAEAKFGAIKRPERKDGLLDSGSTQARTAQDDLRDRLLSTVPESRDERDDEQQAVWLLAQLLQWHQREERTDWWDHFNRLEMSMPELIEDGTALGGLVRLDDGRAEKNSQVFQYSYSDGQDTKLKVGDKVNDPQQLGEYTGEIFDIDFPAGIVSLKRGPSLSSSPHPQALIPDATVRAGAMKESIEELASAAQRTGFEMLSRKYPALCSLLARRSAGGESRRHDMTAAQDGRARALDLDGDFLAIQGPPGAGKTWTAANIVCDLVQAGRHVGVTAHSHAVIENLLDGVNNEAKRRGMKINLGRKVGSKNSAIPDLDNFTANNKADEAVLGREIDVLGATAFYFAREDVRNLFDTLIVDEAGQMSLANAVAAAPAARNLILVGDPQQLDQPARAIHPEGADGSALGHLLGEQSTITPDQGVFLPETRRMHPAITGFISEQFYEGRLGSFADTAKQKLQPAGVGLRFEAVDHDGNKSSSPEEVERVEELTRELLGQTWTDQAGATRPLTSEDILIVAPFNAQVAALRQRLDGFRVGTVDLFQGQEAPVVIYSMTSSDAALAPRGMDFLYSANRLNVAVSRAQGLAIVVANPRLLMPKCSKPDQVHLVSALCRFVEIAKESQRD